MIALTDSQLQTLMSMAGRLAPERRDLFLQRCGAMLALRIHGRDRVVSDDDVVEVSALALCGLVQTPTAAA